jgi:PPM family protein phosphatase
MHGISIVAAAAAACNRVVCGDATEVPPGRRNLLGRLVAAESGGYTYDMDPPAGIWSHCLEVAAITDIGLRRANNQDSYTVALAGDQADFQRRGHLFLVADGMGAHAAGELASKMAADVVSLDYRKLLGQSPAEAIVSALLDANHQIYTRGQASPEFRGMGTTACTLLLLPAGALVAHVGDSRAYRLRGNRIEQLTFDHSLVWEMRASGQFPSGELPSYITKNIITRSLGPNATVQVDLEGPDPVQVGDVFLLCSDGLSGPVRDDEMGMVLGCLPLKEAVRALVDLACLRGGPDNITAIAVRVLGPQAVEASDAAPPVATVAREVRPVHPLLWTLMGVASLATAGLLAMGLPAAAAATGIVGGVAGVAAWRQRYGAKGHLSTDGRRFGRGPYVTCDSAPSTELLGRLTEIVQQLRDAAMSENWAVDWGLFDGFLAKAAAAAQAGDLADAARGHLRALTSMLAQLRKQRPPNDDSGIFV